MKIYVQKGQNVQQNNTKKYVFLSLAAIFLISAILWFKFAGGSAVHDLRNTAQSTRQELTDARTAQQREASDLTEAGRAVERSEQTQRSLEKAETSFNQYEKTAEHKLKVKTRQRNLWIAVSIILGTAALSK